MRLKNLYSMAAALRWAAEVADALALLHEAAPPYIHGDVKADNVLLTDGPDVDAAHAKLGDLKPHRCAARLRGCLRERSRARLAAERAGARSAGASWR